MTNARPKGSGIGWLFEILFPALLVAAGLGGGFSFLLAMRMAAFASLGDATKFSAVLFALSLPVAFGALLVWRLLLGMRGREGAARSRGLAGMGWFLVLAPLGALVMVVMLQPYRAQDPAHYLVIFAWVVVAAVLGMFLGGLLPIAGRVGALVGTLALLLLPGITTTLTAPSRPSFDPSSVTREAREEHRVFLIGLDGATFDVIDPMVAKGELPHLASLMERGARATLMSEMAPNQPFANSASQGMRTPVIWETIITGTRPRDHQVWDFYQTKLPFLSEPLPFRMPFPSRIGSLLGAQDKPIYSTDAEERRAWELFDDFAADSLSVGWVDSWPAFDSGHCGIVSDRAHFDTRATASPEAWEERFAWYYRDFPSIAEDKLGKVFLADYRKAMVDDPDELLEQQGIFDAIMDGKLHDQWYREGLYRETAKQVFGYDYDPEYADKFAKTDPLYWEHHLVGNEAADLARDNFYADVAVDLLKERLANGSGLPELSCFYFPSTDTSQHWLWKYYEPEAFQDVDPGSLERLGDSIPAVYRNADRIVGDLLALADENTTIIIVSDHGGGAWLEQGNAPAGTGESSHEGYSGNHRPNGILIAAGPGIKAGFQGEDRDIYDVLPLVLHVSGLPIAANMPGSVPESILEPDFLALYPVRDFEGYGPRVIAPEVLQKIKAGSAGDDAYMERLAELGYAEGEDQE